MEENENKNVEETKVEVEATSTETTETTETTQNTSSTTEGEGKKGSKKGLIIGVVVAVIAILIVADLVVRSPKETVKKYVSYLNSAHSKKAFDLMDMAGTYVYGTLDEDELDDFYDEYKDFVDGDEWDDYKDQIDEMYDDEFYEDMDDEIKDSDTKVKVKKIEKVKKVSKNLYSVKTKIQTKDEDGDKSTDTVKFYVMKKGTKSYIVGTDGFGF